MDFIPIHSTEEFIQCCETFDSCSYLNPENPIPCFCKPFCHDDSIVMKRLSGPAHISAVVSLIQAHNRKLKLQKLLS